MKYVVQNVPQLGSDKGRICVLICLSPLPGILECQSLKGPSRLSGQEQGSGNTQTLSLYIPNQVVLVIKNPPTNAGDPKDSSSITESGRPPGVGNGNPLQYSWGNSMDRGAWWATVHGVAKSRTPSTHAEQKMCTATLASLGLGRSR